MEIQEHITDDKRIAEVLSDKIVIQNAADGLSLLGNLYYQNFDSIIIHKSNLAPEFFELSTGIAGEILQKFSNYRVRLAIVGDFTSFTGKSIRDFIYESNNGKQVAFVSSTEEALQKLSDE